jgi:hypothetical protein
MVVVSMTKVTAVPKPSAVRIWLEHTMNEHMPRKFESKILFVNIAAINITHADVWLIISSPAALGP